MAYLTYRLATLKNWITGESQNIILGDPRQFEDIMFDYWGESSFISKSKRLQIADMAMLNTDLRRAFGKYSPMGKRILLRVLVQGMSIREASRYTRASTTYWKDWLRKEVLPELRIALADYYKNGKVVID